MEMDYAGALRRGWWLVVLTLAASLVTAAALTAREEPVYTASALTVVAPNSATEDAGDIIRSLETLERRTILATFARLPTTREARTAIAAQLGVDEGALRGIRVHGSVVPNTNILRIVGEGSDRAMVAAVANAAAEYTAREARRLYRVYSLRPLAAAHEPYRPDRPDPQRNLMVGGVIGLVLGIAAALVLERLRSVRRTAGAV